MDPSIFILLFDEAAAGLDPFRKALTGRDQFRIQCVAAVPTALARIAGGGVDIVLISLPSGGSAGDPLADFLKIHDAAPNVPVVVVCDAYDESLGQKAVRKGASDYLIRETLKADLLRILDSTVVKMSRPPILSQVSRRPVKRGRVLACMGAKGGPGATTIALNVASILTENHTVILAELHPDLGTLAAYFQPHRTVQDIGSLLARHHAQPGTHELSPPDIEGALWPCKNVPGLNILFGPQNLESPTRTGPEDAKAILAILTTLADYVVVDLPSSLSDTNRAVIGDSDVLALVIERDPVSVQSAKRILKAMDGVTASLSIGAVVVNRTGLVAPISMAFIESELPAPIFGVIPPAPDLCAAAQKGRTPLVKYDSDSIAASSLRDLAKVISGNAPAVRPKVAVG